MCMTCTANQLTFVTPMVQGTPKSLWLALWMITMDRQANKFRDKQTWWVNLRWLVQQAQSNANLWALLLSATGGALELLKCSYHVLFWKFSLQGAPVLTNMKRELPQLTVSNPYTKATCELEYLNPYSSHKTLGHYI